MLVTTFVLSCIVLASKTAGVSSKYEQYLNPDWVEPHAWAAEKDPLQQLCPAVAECSTDYDKRNVEVALKKLVYSLFDRSKFVQDDSSKYLYRSVHIHATEEQLTKLHKFTNLDEMDGMLAEILQQSNFGTIQLVKEYTKEITSTFWSNMSINLGIPSRTRVIVTNFALLVFTYLACRRFNINFMVAIAFTITYFLYEYLDYGCHKRIAAEDTASFMYGRNQNPCKDSINKGWFGFFVGKNNRDECVDYLMKRDGEQCGMVDLFHEFLINIVFKQMSMFFMKLADLVKSISTTYGIIVTAITLFFMKDILKTIIYSIFKFTLNPASWSGFITSHSRNETSNSPQYQIRSSADIKDINLGKALDLAIGKMQMMSVETINTAIKAHLPTISSQSTTESPSTTKHLHNENKAVELKSMAGSSKSEVQLNLNPSGIQSVAIDASDTSTSATSSSSETESYEEITYDELESIQRIKTAVTSDAVLMPSKDPSPFSDESDAFDGEKSSKSSSSSTLPSDVELLSLHGDGDTENMEITDCK